MKNSSDVGLVRQSVGGRDGHDLRIAALQHPGAKGEVELLGALGVKLIHDGKAEDQAVLLRPVAGDDLELSARRPNLSPGDFDARGNRRVRGHAPGDVEQDRSLLSGGSTDGDARFGGAEEIPEANSSEQS